MTFARSVKQIVNKGISDAVFFSVMAWLWVDKISAQDRRVGLSCPFLLFQEHETQIGAPSLLPAVRSQRSHTFIRSCLSTTHNGSVTRSVEEPAGVLRRKLKLFFRILVATFLSRTFAVRVLNTCSFFLGRRGVLVFRSAPSSRSRHYITQVNSVHVFRRFGFAPRLSNLAKQKNAHASIQTDSLGRVASKIEPTRHNVP